VFLPFRSYIYGLNGGFQHVIIIIIINVMQYISSCIWSRRIR